MKKITFTLLLLALVFCGLNATEISVQPGGSLWVGTNVRLGVGVSQISSQGMTATWNLGDSSPVLTGMDVEHVFKDPGTYQVTCTLSNGNVITTTLQIQERRTIQVQPAAPKVGEEVRFQAHQFGHPQIRWNFGDGSIQTAGSPATHTYANPGPVTVKAYDFNGQSTVAVEVSLNVAADLRTIVAGSPPHRANIPVQFTANNFPPGSLHWVFGDGNQTNGGTTMQHVFTSAGTYTVSVGVAGDSNPKTMVINVAPDPRNVSADSGNPGLYETVTLQAVGFPPGNLEWNFGDGESKTAGQQVTHAYSNLGQFQVSVKSAGSANPPITLQIRVNQDRRRIQVQPSQARVGDSVRLKVVNVDSNVVDWQVGDENLTARPLEINHRFLDPGMVTVTCRINGQSSLTAQVNVRDHRRIQSFPDTVFAGAEVQFQLQNGLGPRVRWEFSDGVTRVEGLRMKRAFPQSGMVELKVYDANGDAQVPLTERIRIMPEIRSIKTLYSRYFVGTDVTFEALRFRENMVEWFFGDGSRRMGPAKMAYQYRSPGRFTVKAVDFRGKDGKSIEFVLDVEADQRSIDAPPRIRVGEPVTLQLKGVQNGGYQWDLGAAGRGSGMVVRDVVFPSPGRIAVRVSDVTQTYPPFNAIIMVQPDNRSIEADKFALPGEEVEVKALGFDGPQVAWDFGDGHKVVSPGLHANHTYKEKGTYRIIAKDQGGMSAKEFERSLTVVELLPEFSLKRLELAFSSGKAYMVVPRKSRPPVYSLKLMSSGRGVLRGHWKLDDQVLGLFSMVLQDGRVATLKRGAMPRLPVLDVGMHKLTLDFTNYRFAGRIPHLRYFVSSGGAIVLVSPDVGGKIPAADKVKLVWKPIRQASEYEVAVSEVPFQFLDDRQIEWQATVEPDHYQLDMTKYKADAWIYWMVRGKNDSGRVLTSSEIGSFKRS